MKSLKNGNFPPALGDLTQSHDDLLKTGTEVIGTCYENPTALTSMSEHQYYKWKRITNGKSKRFKLEALPPTTEAFTLHIRRAHYQAAMWQQSVVLVTTTIIFLVQAVAHSVNVENLSMDVIIHSLAATQEMNDDDENDVENDDEEQDD